MTPEYFAYNQYRDYVIYKALSKSERVAEFKRILEILVEQEYSDYEFWGGFLKRPPNYRVGFYEILFFKIVRKIFGLSFTAKLLEGHEKEMQGTYRAYLETVEDAELRAKIEEIIRREQEHERSLISQVEGTQVSFISNIVLGVNDGLIELSGALVGFSFAFAQLPLISLSGVIVGLAASLSMAASAYMQARHEEGKNPIKAALYTGVSYLLVAILLIAPFLFSSTIHLALALMLIFSLCIIALLTFYTSVIFERKFSRGFFEMAAFSLGVALITFLIGLGLREVAGVSL